MRRSLTLCIAALLLVAAITLPRVFAGTLLVKYDLLFWESMSAGYAPIVVALGAKLLSLSVALFALVALFRDRARRVAWALVLAVSVASLLSVSLPSERDLSRVIDRGEMLITRIESYSDRHGRYPSSLKDIGGVPKTGLARERRFYYAAAQSTTNDRGPCFPDTRAYLGKSAYVVCVPLVPGGTLMYRPDGNYSDQRFGHPRRNGWFHTGKD